MLLTEKLKNYRIILASNSPRRKQLMEGAEIPFVMGVKYEADETVPAGMAAEKAPEYLSGVKSASYPAPLGPGEILVTADTVVLLDGQLIGKPEDREDALRIVARLSGRTHKVVTGVTLRSAEKERAFSAESSVKFRELSSEEIEFYVDRYRPFDKAGAYGIQEWIGYVGIERIDGSFYNVMGLPIQMLYRQLGHFISEE